MEIVDSRRIVDTRAQFAARVGAVHSGSGRAEDAAGLPFRASPDHRPENGENS
jgi:hypothetical protein